MNIGIIYKEEAYCPNRVNSSKPSVTNTSTPGTTVNTKPTYYNKKPWNSNQPKPKMSNPFKYF